MAAADEDIALPTEYVLAYCNEKELITAQRRRIAEKTGMITEEEKELEGSSRSKLDRAKSRLSPDQAVAAAGDPGDRIVVKIYFPQNQQEINVPVSKVYQENSEKILEIANDLTTLTFLEEANVLSALKYRYTKERIYTSIAGVVVAINPCKRLPLYTNDVMKGYRNASSVNDQGSHVYKAAEDAFRNLTAKFNFSVRKFPVNQSMVVCGESGSGKTESAKHIMRYLANRSNDLDKVQVANSKESATIEQQIVDTNYILEAIGNAKTRLNHNSSRFGNSPRCTSKLEIWILRMTRKSLLPESTRS